MLNQLKHTHTHTHTHNSSLPCNLVSGLRKVNGSRNKDGPHLLLFCPLQLQPPGWQLASQPLNVCAPPGPRAKWDGRQPGPYRPGLRPPSSSWVPAPNPPHPPPPTPQPFAQSPGSFPPGPPSSSWVSPPQPFTQFPPPRHRSFPTGAAGPTPKGAAFSP